MLGVNEGDQLRYVGNVGTGFNDKEIAKLLKLLRPLHRGWKVSLATSRRKSSPDRPPMVHNPPRSGTRTTRTSTHHRGEETRYGN